MEEALTYDDGCVPECARTMYVQFQSYQNKVACGKLYSLYYEQEFDFYGLDQLLLIMDDIMDSVNYPQSSVNHRNLKNCNPYFLDLSAWTPKKDLHAADGERDNTAKTGVEIRVYYRQQASMQGEIRVKGRKVYFRSGMELMRLLHQYLQKW
ncbi:hypothetical protein [Diplocloster agilis]|uniref:Uncharacterized protein n=1 Tax=Diplocloster agilis TaxID=2850323 RepID=A0A949K4N4_9FIRM|nr:MULTISPECIES: hypothetical protein [Lachnospiraceae]SCJ48058.1 Uncharacterised protein [uncultured Clostridium sp.]MBU9736805.1 hypothetical protein [Diplocloster agilis]MBU9736806.1 hypothetical protein [Diplocloster agilis]MBU9744872.1 hypothetical protein [Diplocloster agilis]MCU6734642.1 hypothetical protein [Suonthocola fibrivorans]